MAQCAEVERMMAGRALVVISKLTTAVEKKTRTTVDTIMVSPEQVQAWKRPPFQRPITVNDKVRALAEKMKVDDGVWPGSITLGIFGGLTYIVDGQHRGEAFQISGCKFGYVDVRIHHFESMSDMALEFVEGNQPLVRMRPDDVLRALECVVPALQDIRKRCPFVGYDMIRRGPSSPIVSMAMILRIWRGSAAHVPGPKASGLSTSALAMTLIPEEADHLIHFLVECHAAFGREQEYLRLWGGLNLVMCMWLYRRLVIAPYSTKTPRLTRDLFRKCLLSLSANSDYLDWLVGRQIGERDRVPAYTRIKACFTSRLKLEMVQKSILLPQPDWAHG